jgi:hypothetical protein
MRLSSSGPISLICDLASSTSCLNSGNGMLVSPLRCANQIEHGWPATALGY